MDESAMKTIREIAIAWGVTPRRIQSLCAAGKIAGAKKVGRCWMIPENTLKPEDRREKTGEYRNWRNKKNDNWHVIEDNDTKKELELRFGVINSLSSDYLNIFLVTRDTRTYKIYRWSNDEITREVKSIFEDCSEKTIDVVFEKYIDAFVLLEDRDRLKKDVDVIKNELQGFSGKKFYTCHYRRIYGDDFLYFQIDFTSFIGLDGRDYTVVGFKNIDMQIRHEIALKLQRHERVDFILRSMADDFVCLIDVDIESMDEEQFIINDKFSHVFCDESESDKSFFYRARNFAKKYIVKKDEERFLQAIDWKNLKDTIEENGSLIIEYEIMLNGEDRNLQSKFVFNRSNNGKLHMMVGIRDLTRRVKFLRRQEQKRNSLKNMLKLLSEEYHNVFFVDLKDDEAFIFRMDEEIKRELNINENTYYVYSANMRRYIDRYVVPEYKEKLLNYIDRDYLMKELAEKKVISFRYVTNRSDEDHYVMVKIARDDAAGKDKSRVIIGFADVDEEMKRELEYRKDIEAAYQAAENANKAKSTFLFNMSHDIRTPMNAILGFTDMLNKYRDDEKKFQECVENIQLSGQCLLDLINNVLDMARIESGQAILDEETGDVSTINNEIAVVFKEALKNKKLTFHHSVDVEHKYVYGDKVKLKKIFLNLLSNAIKYTPEGGEIYFQLKELPSYKEGICYFQTVIKDTGIGMAKEFLPYLYDSFSREKTVTENGIVGSGLGMGITKKLVEIMNGTIDVKSELGEGTKFTIVIPHRIAEQPKNEIEKIPMDISIFKGKRILLAEDNELNREIATDILEDVGFEVVGAEDGIVCVDLLERSPAGYFDLILMDIQMPNMDGYKATMTIRKLTDQRKANIPIIAMTANVFDEDRNKAFEVGMNDFMQKPIEVDKLFLAIYDAIKDAKVF